MKITFDTLQFPFTDQDWKRKMVPALLLGMGGLLIPVLGWPLLWLIQGYGMRIMRRTIEGAAPSLPEWDDWGQLFKDGLRAVVINVVYMVPVGLLMLAAFAFMAMTFAATVSAPTSQAAAASILAFMAVSVVFSFGIGLISALAFPAQFLAHVALVRAVAHHSLKAGLDVRAVWNLAREGIRDFGLAYGLTMVVGMGIGTAATFLAYSLVGLCLVPFIMGPLTLYQASIMGALMGMAYRQTQERFAMAGIIT